MRTTISIINLMLLLATQKLPGQERNDYIWMIGRGSFPGPNETGGSKINFNFTPPEVTSFSNPSNSPNEIATISDSSGRLQFFSSGCEVFNPVKGLMTNGDSLNYPGQNFELNCVTQGYYKAYRSLLPLPQPSHDSIHFLFHLRYDSNWISPLFQSPRSFLYTKIDMSKENGLGAVVEKNVEIFKDTFIDALTAVRHGNGRDWWIPVVKRLTDTLFLFRFEPNGVVGPKICRVQLPWKGNGPEKGPLAQNVFSPDGRTYACMDFYNGVHVYHFDRCTGEFSDARILFISQDTFICSGLAISPNSRFLYATQGRKLYQYDLEAIDVNASRVTIANYKLILSPWLPATFYQMQLAPDKKIYMSATNSVKVLHVISKPDEKGAACEFLEAGFALPTHNGSCLPNFPNFRLHELSGGPCDSLTLPPIDSLHCQTAPFFKPNPASEKVEISWPVCPVSGLDVFNAIGQKVLTINELEADKPISLDVSGWAAGVYFVNLRFSENGSRTARLVVIH